jgi:hypothetical protein
MEKKVYLNPFVIIGVVLGLISGILWFKVGEILDGHTCNFIAWFISPLILPLLITGVYLLIKYSRYKLILGIIFVSVYYGFHWLPMLLVLLYFILFNVKM